MVLTAEVTSICERRRQGGATFNRQSDSRNE